MRNFSKMHSLGNDFMVIDGVTHAFAADPQSVIRWSNRNTGVGFDQLLIVAPPSDPECDFDYLIYNADGSEAEQCGNGTRCVTDFVYRLGLTQQSNINWHSKGGLVQTAKLSDGNIETWMPAPLFEYARVPFQHFGSNGSQELQTELGAFTVFPVSMGSPHGVIFVDDVIGLDVNRIGPLLSSHTAFPERANIGFCQIVNDGFIRLRVFERGAEETLACGSGACAAVVAGKQLGKLRNKTKVSLPGGKLRVEWPSGQGPVKLIGDSTLVYQGTLEN